MNKNYIGENIRIYRERRGMTQKDLGEKIGKTWEMVSRYERGISSPFNQIDSLADALNVNSSDLFKKPEDNKQYVLNRVPLFKSIPKDMDFSNTKTYEYYTAPDWMLDKDLECFVIDTELLSNKEELERKTGSLKRGEGFEKGCLFISPNCNIEKNDIVLKREGSKLIVEKPLNTKKREIIGKVLGQEIRF